MYKANLSLRTALKILVPIYQCRINSEHDLYQAAYDYPWENHFTANETIAIDSVVFGETFTHSLYVSQKVKDAIADSFRAKTGQRPSVNLKHPDVRINVHIDQDQCSFSLDSSGASLHHRGYRTATNIAPLNDINRKEFAFEKWADWDEDLYLTIEESQLNKIQGLAGTISGFDKAPSAIEKAKDNVRNANLEEFISIDKDNFFFTQKEQEGPLHIVTNPPYGERLEGDINALYSSFGDTLKQHYTNTQAWMITSNLEAMKHVGLRPSRKIKLFNGKLESRLLHFNIYPGTKKIHKLNSSS